jgi:hypothetical protein
LGNMINFRDVQGTHVRALPAVGDSPRGQEGPRLMAGTPGSRPNPLDASRRRRTRAELDTARDARLPDLIADDLAVLLAGINPGLSSAADGHHFATPGNRLWPALYRAGFTPRLLRAEEEDELLGYGIGITSIVSRPTVRAAELTRREYVEGGERRPLPAGPPREEVRAAADRRRAARPLRPAGPRTVHTRTGMRPADRLRGGARARWRGNTGMSQAWAESGRSCPPAGSGEPDGCSPGHRGGGRGPSRR